MEYQTTCTRAILPPKIKKSEIVDSKIETKSRGQSGDSSNVNGTEPEITSPSRQLLRRKRSFSVDLRFSPKNEDKIYVAPSVSRRRANTTDYENLIGTTISFDCVVDSNENHPFVECENSSGSEISIASNHHSIKDFQTGISRSRQRRFYAPATPHSMDVECGKCFTQISSESPIVASSTHRQKQPSVWIKYMRILMTLCIVLLVSTSFSNVLVESSTPIKSPSYSLERADDIINNVHTVKNFGKWELMLEDEEPSYIEDTVEKIQGRKKRRPILSAANNLASQQQWNTQQGVYIPKPKKIKEFVMTDDEIRKKTALLNDENYKIQKNKFKMDMVWLSIALAFVGTFLISMYKQFRNMNSFAVHSHSK